MEEFSYQFLKFCIVGFSGLIIDFGITYLVKEKLNRDKYLAHTIGFVVSVINNFVWNKHWTFENQNSDYIVQGFEFLIISALGLFFSNVIIYMLNTRIKINFYISKFFAIGIVVIWNFFANSYFTFSN